MRGRQGAADAASRDTMDAAIERLLRNEPCDPATLLAEMDVGSPGALVARVVELTTAGVVRVERGAFRWHGRRA